MSKLLRFIALFLFIAAGTYTYAATDSWQKGNTYYNQKQYDSAAIYFGQLAAMKPHDAVVYYNLGNAYYRLNKIGQAVLNYERALHIDPGFAEAKDNLSLAQNRIPNRIQGAEDIFFLRWWNSWTAGSTANMWAILAFTILLVWMVLLIMSRLDKIRRMTAKANITIGAVLCVILLLGYVSASNRNDSGKGVVMYPDTALMNEPKEGRHQSLIPEGTTVTMEDESLGWIKVQLPDGRMGWIQKDLLTKI